MEPELTTAPELAGILEELRAREPIFHQRQFGTTRADFERMTAEDFWEVSASGRRFSRAYVLDLLEERYSQTYEDHLEASGFHCRQLAPDLYLIAYTLLQDKVRVTRRTTLWRKTTEGWKIVFHQGTVVADAGTA